MSKIADFIEQDRELLVRRFLEEAAARESTQGLRPAEVLGSLPAYLAALAVLLREGPRPEPMAAKRRLEEAHLGQRLRLGFTWQETVDEYVLLGRLISQRWEHLPRERQPGSSELHLLREALDAARAHAEEFFSGYSLEESQREKRYLRRLDALVPEALGGDAGLQARLAPLLEVIQRALEAQGAELLLALEEGGPLERVAAIGVLNTGEDEGGPYTRVELRLLRHGGLLGVLSMGLARARTLEPRARRTLETLAEHLRGILERVCHLERERRRSEQLQFNEDGSVALENARLYTALRESEDRLRLTVHAAKLGTWDYNPATDVLRWDERCKELFGLPPDALVTWDTFLTGLHPEDRARTEEAVQRAMSGADGGSYAIEYRTRGARDGVGYWVAAHGRAFFDEQGRVVRFIGTVFDITARKQLENALRASEEHLRRVVTATGVGSWELELDTQRVVADARLLELFWLPPDAPFSLERALDAMHPEDRQLVARAVAAAVAGENGGRYDVEYRTLSGDGRMRWVGASGQSFFDSNSGTRRFLGIGLDITERKAAEEALRERSMFERQLIGIVSHDLRNPLNTILLGVQALLRRDELDERATRTSLRIQQAAERATRLVRDLLDFTQARLGGGLPLERGPVDLHDVAESVVDEVQAAHPDRVLLVEARGDGRGEWDGDRLAQLLINLVINAVTYSPADTPITVRTVDDGAEVMLEVHNEGPPIPPDVLPVLFQPLQRGEGNLGTAERSVGLGLYIVDQVARAHRGSVDVRSSLSEGITFTVRLPRSASPVPRR
ncbi:PAS domain S-box-containing protein [Archangium gephyra]|uniref:histidine kinase n=1 Tax=Archangium gephyra TaxID=48 RepID=A0AAC8Q8Z1_9BACT|nr:HAMP domain-containing sensor histidine kinase [Archangium gephyra]AKJ03050.1 Chemotaxis protein methyltransferase CheR [Archangium gephyra]REG25174.1 PAS domain S-box-containing protein [Archangium gephyra]